jgi:hypothetical protein
MGFRPRRPTQSRPIARRLRATTDDQQGAGPGPTTDVESTETQTYLRALVTLASVEPIRRLRADGGRPTDAQSSTERHSRETGEAAALADRGSRDLAPQAGLSDLKSTFEPLPPESSSVTDSTSRREPVGSGAPSINEFLNRTLEAEQPSTAGRIQTVADSTEPDRTLSDEQLLEREITIGACKSTGSALHKSRPTMGFSASTK